MSNEKVLFVFRRDHRLYDNVGLNSIDAKNKTVVPIFIFDNAQVTSKNKFKSNRSVHFMCESLLDLNKQLNGKLRVFQGDPETVIKGILSQNDFGSVVMNKDYTPYSQKRDSKIKKVCEMKKVKFCHYEDYLLAPMGTIMKNKEKKQPYTIYSWFLKKTPSANKIDKPKSLNSSLKFLNSNEPKYKGEVSLTTMTNELMKSKDNWVEGGRSKALELMKKIPSNYNSKRNCLNQETTNLSAYIHFGNVSVREVYHHSNTTSGIRDQLWWREFYYYILHYFPERLTKKYPFPWKTNSKHFNAWKQGKTGFPLVDAGMRQLKQTGYMHNRARLNTASFLIKNLMIDWRKGEKYFAQSLVDYSIASNNGNWLWVSSLDPSVSNMPSFRVFNPWEQSKKHDPKAEYIKKYLPELSQVPAKDIHKWNEVCEKYPNVKYPKPIVDYEQTKKEYLSKTKT